MDVIKKFKNIRVYQENGNPSLHKPVLLLIALNQCDKGENRLCQFSELDELFNEIFAKFSLDGKAVNSHYPFGKLENDGIWEVSGSGSLKRTSVGHLFKKELIDEHVVGGFTEEVYNALILDKTLIHQLTDYFLKAYIPEELRGGFCGFLDIHKINNKVQETRKKEKMALLNNYKFAVSRWWLSQGLEIIQTKPDIFAAKNLREAMKFFIAGSAVIKSINAWMVAIQLVDRKKNGLTDFGFSLYKNDPKLLKSATWWSIHLSLCFSDASDPYSHFFLKLDNLTKDWLSWKVFSTRIYSTLDDAAEQSIDSSLDGIKKMFQGDSPLAELGLIEISKGQNNTGSSIRLGAPKLSDEIFIHALALARFSSFKSRDSVSFSELSATGLAHFLCCSKDSLRQNLQRMSQMHEWQTYFSFDYAVDLDSITFKESCDPNKTILFLLQNGQDTWL